MRRMSFAMTTQQVRDQTKTVTRRQRWLFLKRGDLLQPVVKAQGLKKGQKQELIGGPIRVLSVRREEIYMITDEEVEREGFYDMDWELFVSMYCDANRCQPLDICTRIEFEYLNSQNSATESVPADGNDHEVR